MARIQSVAANERFLLEGFSSVAKALRATDYLRARAQIKTPTVELPSFVPITAIAALACDWAGNNDDILAHI